MATIKVIVGPRTALPITISGLAGASYAQSNMKDNTGNSPLDLLIELSVTPGTVSGNKQALLFALASLDGTNFQTGASTNDEGDMTFIGALPLNSNAATQTKIYSAALAYGGSLPPFLRFVVKNDSGATLSGGSINVAEVTSTVA